MKTQSKSQKRGVFTRFLDGVEWLGNLLPHPVTLFALICLGVLLLSGIAGYFEWSVKDPRDPEKMIRAVSLLNPEGLRSSVGYERLPSDAVSQRAQVP